MDELICKEKHKRIDERLDIQDRRLNNHSERIDKLEQYRAEDRAEIRNLCKQLENLTNTIKFIGGPLLAGLIGFFFYAIQKGILK